MPAIKESNVTILVQDMDKAVSFYQKIGLTLKNRWGNHYAQLETTGITIGLHPGGKPAQSSDHISIGFMIDDIAEAKALLEQNQIPYKYDDGKSGKFTHFKDLDGTVLYFMQPMY
jgi:catechol 2,3-dioxygenase-like lactoylglutathione lyase family enzyme